jgi:hypothetical protein
MGSGGILAHGGCIQGSVSSHLCGIWCIHDSDTGLGSSGCVPGGGGIVLGSSGSDVLVTSH